MGSFRAKDADRDRFVELIEAAYVDGQLGAADRELRVGRALAAETLDELEGLTRDLQGRPPTVVPTSEPPAPVRGPSRPAARTGLGVALVVAAVVAVLGFVPLVLLASSPDQGSSSGDSASAPATAVEQPVVEEQTVPFEMTPASVRRFLKAYEKKFGTLDAWEVGFYPGRVGVQVPVSKVRKRFERWSWDGTWRQDSEASAVIGPQKFVSLGRLEVSRMFDNITRAKRTLDVPHGMLTHVLINDWGEGPSVNIYITNRFNDSGYLKTTLSGEVLRSFPYDS